MTKVNFQTNMGIITIEVDNSLCPQTAANFIEYCEAGYYNDTIFHRVINGFMIQGGGFTADMVQKDTNRPIANEAKLGLKNEIGTIAMARTSDPHSATSQFFINVANNDFLNFKDETIQGYGYCAFAKVVAGMEVVMKISHVNTINKGVHQNVPEVDVIIQKTQVLTQDAMAEA